MDFSYVLIGGFPLSRQICQFPSPSSQICFLDSDIRNLEIRVFESQMLLCLSIDYRCDNRRFWLSVHNCQAPTPASQNLELEQQIRIFGAD